MIAAAAWGERELLNEKVNLLLNSETDLNRYIENGVAEIHWNGKKTNHFALIANLLQSTYKEQVTDIISEIIKHFDGMKLAKIVQDVDSQVPEEHASYKIPYNRKQLIIKMITLRIQKLRVIINEGV